LIAGGTRYHAHFVPDEDSTTGFYETACETLNAAGVAQYEISNFARPGVESRHNLKYWTRRPYLGFGVDAHSMLRSADPSVDAVRFSTGDALEKYVAGSPLQKGAVSWTNALEESFFLGLRLNRGVDVRQIVRNFGQPALDGLRLTIDELVAGGLLQQAGEFLRLTPRGRLLSNEVFQAFLVPADASASA
jgi:coproporphyrinogen III oxidase-like Fe-S oxidoreductase